MLTYLINSFFVLLSLGTATGVLLHDMRLDKMAVTALSAPAAAPTYEAPSNKLTTFSTDLHTHTERHVFEQTINDLKMSTPRLQPRSNEDRKHLLQKHITKGYHAFDNYNLPIV